MEHSLTNALHISLSAFNDLINTSRNPKTLKQLQTLEQLQTLMLKTPHASNPRLANHLIRLLAASGNLNEAVEVFRKLAQPDVHSWAAIISGFVKNRHSHEAIHLYHQLQRTSLKPNDYVYVAVLRACADTRNVREGRIVHMNLIENGYGSNLFVGNSLVNMYAKCGSLDDAQRAFKNLGNRDIVSWNALIGGYAENRHVAKGFNMLLAMVDEGLKPDRFSFISLLKACRNEKALDLGRLLHRLVVESEYDTDPLIGSILIDMYGKWGFVDEALQVFDRLPKRYTVSWNTLMTAFVQNGLDHEALQLYHRMIAQAFKPDGVTYVSVLKACCALGELEQAKLIQSSISRSRLESDVFVGSALVGMHVKFGNIDEAFRAFEQIHDKNLVSWNAIIHGCAQHGHGHEALRLFARMQHSGIRPDGITFVSALKSCIAIASLDQGQKIHAQILGHKLESDMFVASALVDMYSKCGSLDHARLVFDKLRKRDIVIWNAMLGGYLQHGLAKDALNLYKELQQSNIKANALTFLSLLKACATLQSLNEAKPVLAEVKKSGLELDTLVGNAIVDMFAKCGSLREAEEGFSKLPERSVVSWNALISGYAQNGAGRDALELYKKMQREGVQPDAITFVGLIQACSSLLAVDEGRLIHAEIEKLNFEGSMFIGSSLIDMYVNCGNMNEARTVFDQLSARDAVCWNAMIEGYVRHGPSEQAFELLGAMQQEDIIPDAATLVSILKACGSLKALDRGTLIHLSMSEAMSSDPLIGNALVDMYSKCGSLDDASEAFENLSQKSSISWNLLITGYSQQGFAQRALQLFKRMQSYGASPDGFTFVSILKACSCTEDLNEGKSICALICESPFKFDPFVRNALVEMYAKCGSLDEAREVFDNLVERDVGSWNAMITGYASNGAEQEAILLFEKMQQTDVTPDPVTFASVLKACGNALAIQKGKLFHQLFVDSGIQANLYIKNTLVDMYARFGSLDEALQVFRSSPEKDLVTWNALIGGYAQHGFGWAALNLFDRMNQEGFRPDGVTFINLLSACSHARLVDEGVRLFRSMSRDYGIVPTIRHYSCLIDLLSRAGNLCEAECLINTMPLKPDASVWMPLLGACRTYMNLELGRRSFASILKLDPSNTAAHILMSNIYAAAGQWKDNAFIK